MPENSTFVARTG